MSGLRDIVIILVVFGSLPYILRRPYIGVLMWVWLSVMNPHRQAWGIAVDFNFAAIVAAVTLFSALIHKEQRKPLPVNPLTITLLVFFGWTTITTYFAFYPEYAFVVWTTFFKTQLMALLIPLFIHRREQVQQLLWVIAMSLAYYGVKGGLFVIRMGGDQRVWGPAGSYIEDNNALALALVVLIPLLRYLQLTTEDKRIRWGLSATMLICALSVVGSFSRGAMVAVVTMGFFLYWKSRQKTSILMLILLAVPLVLAIMPAKWYDRMDLIVNYEQDTSGSANMRLNSWQTMFNIAKDRPLTGGGFDLGTRDVYDRYSPNKELPPQTAHSIYFQAMGEHGFLGLGLYLIVLFLFWRQAGGVARACRGHPELAWAQNFGLMMQVSLVAFMAGGAFLSLVYYDVPYYLLYATVVVRRIVDDELTRLSPGRTQVPLNPYSTMPARPAPSPSTGAR
jgi:putative inorganic carbon (HCO3(-)) transporter